MGKLSLSRRIIAVLALIGLSSISFTLLAQTNSIRLLSEQFLTEDQILDRVYTTSTAIAVKVLDNENFLGSGILMSKQGNVYTVLTNDHVLRSGDGPYKIQAPDGEIYAAVEKLRESSFDKNDLATLEFTSEKGNYAIAVLANSVEPGDEVFAAGFPFSALEGKVFKEETPLQKTHPPTLKGFVFLRGQVFLTLEQALEGGYQLGYTNEIEKGMSGGPLLNRWGEVVAIHGMHAYPLWGDPYVYKDGSQPPRELWEQLFHYSWGIPIETYKDYR